MACTLAAAFPLTIPSWTLISLISLSLNSTSSLMRLPPKWAGLASWLQEIRAALLVDVLRAVSPGRATPVHGRRQTAGKSGPCQKRKTPLSSGIYMAQTVLPYLVHPVPVPAMHFKCEEEEIFTPRDEACDLLTWHHRSRTKILPWAWARDKVGWFTSEFTHALSPIRRGRVVCVWLQGSPLISAKCAIIHLSPASLLNFPFQSFTFSFHVLCQTLKTGNLRSFPISPQVNLVGFPKFLFLTPKGLCSGDVVLLLKVLKWVWDRWSKYSQWCRKCLACILTLLFPDGAPVTDRPVWISLGSIWEESPIWFLFVSLLTHKKCLDLCCHGERGGRWCIFPAVVFAGLSRASQWSSEKFFPWAKHFCSMMMVRGSLKAGHRDHTTIRAQRSLPRIWGGRPHLEMWQEGYPAPAMPFCRGI